MNVMGVIVLLFLVFILPILIIIACVTGAAMCLFRKNKPTPPRDKHGRVMDPNDLDDEAYDKYIESIRNPPKTNAWAKFFRVLGAVLLLAVALIPLAWLLFIGACFKMLKIN